MVWGFGFRVKGLGFRVWGRLVVVIMVCTDTKSIGFRV
jgi:hypothetical protein